jgi:hypothetical protein
MKMHMPDQHRDEENRELKAPAALVSALQGLPKPAIFIPPTVDEAILRTAERHLAPRRNPGVAWMRLARWAVAAATAVVALMLVVDRGSGFAREDVNRDGTLDILDAFTLARELAKGRPSDSKLDLNGDGIVDERDVAVVAARAVSLDKGGRS